MADVLTPEQRRRCMQHNRSRDTGPERRLARALWGAGVRYRKHSGRIPGHPDLSIRKYRLAIFVDGDFWHGKDWEHKRCRFHANREFWISKIERNRCRDRRVTALLEAKGWRVMRFWETDVNRDLGGCLRIVLDYLAQFTSVTAPKYIPADYKEYQSTRYDEEIALAAEGEFSYGVSPSEN